MILSRIARTEPSRPATNVSRPQSRWRSRLLTAIAAAMLMQDFAGVSADDAHVVIPGYERFRSADLQTSPLSSIDAGRLLISELNCQSCHGSFGSSPTAPRQAPILTGVADRVDPESVRRLLRNPQHEKPGTAMPSIRGVGENEEIQNAIVAFLTQGGSWRAAAVGADAVRRGETLFHTVGCAACHSDQRPQEEVERIRRGIMDVQGEVDDEEEDEDVSRRRNIAWTPPSYVMPLGQPERKYSLSSLISFLREPHTVRPSGRMPSMNLTPEEARDIASYLLRNAEIEPNIHYEYFEGSWQELPDFTSLQPKATGKTTDFSVGVAPRTELFGLRFRGYLHLPRDGQYRFFLSSDDGSRLLISGDVVVNHDGIHPAGFRDARRRLKSGPHEIVVEYFEFHGEESLTVEIEGPDLPRQPLAGLVTLTSEPPVTPAKPDMTVSPDMIQLGRQSFATLGCAACHQHGNGEQQIRWTGSAPAFSEMKSDRLTEAGGCLSTSPEPRAPVFALTDQQRRDIADAIADFRVSLTKSGDAEDSDHGSAESAERGVTQIMTTMNCYACHTRGKLGGVSESLTHVFTGSIPEMGDEGRIPPSLDGAGDKLNERWLHTILAEGTRDRPYMGTRMPRFGPEVAVAAAGRLITSDIGPEVATVAMPEPEHRLKADARLMIGDQALSCIKCHTFDVHAATGIQSLDMTTMTRRLRRDWFHRYLMNPQAYRPGTRMPAAWPNGQSIVPHILNGDPAVQIEAIWLYLQDGKEAKVPAGLVREAIELTPKGRPLIYRNFLEGLSPRGIAVGFEQRVHYAWDAEQMAPRLIWHGAFIDASKHWVGRGPGNQSPLGDHVMTLPSGPPLASLKSLDAPWPDGNPRDNGFQFRGYSLNAAGTPSFRYTWESVTVTDTLEPFPAEPDHGLKRTITIRTNSEVPRLFLRAGLGREVDTDGNTVIVDGIRYHFDETEPLVRSHGDLQELLIPITPDVSGMTTVSYSMVW